MSSCNNTTYIQMVRNSAELQLQFHKMAFFTQMLEYNVPTAMVINKALTPIWIIIGTFGNIVSALVWSSPRMRTCPTIAYYLTCLSLADLIFLIILIFSELKGSWLIGTLDLQGWCQIFSVINISVQYLCVFLVFAFTVERFLSICYPFKSERFGKTRTPRILLYLVVLCIVLGLPQAYFWDLNLVGECQVRTEVNTKKVLSFYSIYTWSTELAIFGVLPILVLFLNIAVVIKIKRIGKSDFGQVKVGSKSRETLMKHHHDDTAPRVGGVLGSSNPHSISKKDPEKLMTCTAPVSLSHGSGPPGPNANQRGTTITLLWVSFFLIFTMLPNTIMYALQVSVPYGPMPCRIEDMGGDPQWRNYFTFQTIKLIIKEISLSHHVANFFIYLATSSRFVQQVLVLFHISKKRKGSPLGRSVTANNNDHGRGHHPLLSSYAGTTGGQSNTHCEFRQQSF